MTEPGESRGPDETAGWAEPIRSYDDRYIFGMGPQSGDENWAATPEDIVAFMSPARDRMSAEELSAFYYGATGESA